MPSKSRASSKSTRGKRAASKAKTAPVPEPVVETTAPEPVVETVSVETTQTSELMELTVEDQFKNILERIQEFRSLAVSLAADVKKLQKNVHKQMKENGKKNRKRRVNASGEKRPPSGFAKPTQISNSLCQFLGLPNGTEIARTEVTKRLTKYIKAHDLQDVNNKRIINCDPALATLLNVKPDNEVTYFNLQRYMKPHFPKSAAALAAAATA